MKTQYRLIKKYPGSPFLGKVLEPKVGKEETNTNNFYWGGSWFNPNDFPEYWEEVVEKDYQILKSCPIEGTIYSVKRLSDGEVFTVGDKAKTVDINGRHTITQFRIKQKCFGKNFSGNYTYDGIDRIWIDWEENCGGNWLESTIKLKQPIYLTHDGKDIFPEDIVWYVNKENFYHDYIKAYPEVKFNSEIRAYFLAEEEAKKYIIENKPALSIKEFWEITWMETSGFNKNTYMKNLVKERLNLK